MKNSSPLIPNNLDLERAKAEAETLKKFCEKLDAFMPILEECRREREAFMEKYKDMIDKYSPQKDCHANKKCDIN